MTVSEVTFLKRNTENYRMKYSRLFLETQKEYRKNNTRRKSNVHKNTIEISLKEKFPNNVRKKFRKVPENKKKTMLIKILVITSEYHLIPYPPQ